MKATTTAELRAKVHRIVTSRLTVYGAVVGGLVVAAVGGASVLPDIDETSRTDPRDVLVATSLGFVSTAFLSWLALRAGLRAQKPASSVAARTMLASLANAPAAFVLVTLLEMRSSYAVSNLGAILIGVPLTAIFGLVFTVPLGIVYAAVYAGVVEWSEDALAPATHRATSAARFYCAGAAIVSIVGIALVAQFTDLDVRHVAPYALAVAGLAALDVGIGVFERERADRWIAKVRARSVPELALVPRAEARVAPDLVPLAPLDDGALAVVRASGETPYRERPEAVALVPSR